MLVSHSQLRARDDNPEHETQMSWNQFIFLMFYYQLDQKIKWGKLMLSGRLSCPCSQLAGSWTDSYDKVGYYIYCIKHSHIKKAYFKAPLCTRSTLFMIRPCCYVMIMISLMMSYVIFVGSIPRYLHSIRPFKQTDRNSVEVERRLCQ